MCGDFHSLGFGLWISTFFLWRASFLASINFAPLLPLFQSGCCTAVGAVDAAANGLICRASLPRISTSSYSELQWGLPGPLYFLSRGRGASFDFRLLSKTKLSEPLLALDISNDTRTISKHPIIRVFEIVPPQKHHFQTGQTHLYNHHVRRSPEPFAGWRCPSHLCSGSRSGDRQTDRSRRRHSQPQRPHPQARAPAT